MSNASESQNEMPVCANCGKGEEQSSIDLKSCAACKLVKYCSRECQIAHRPQHKKECRKRAKELHDEKLFEQPPPEGDCPICFQRLPFRNGSIYMACCGKVVCCGCIYAVQIRSSSGPSLCPFCRTPAANSDEEIINRHEKRADLNDPKAIHSMGVYHAEGLYGLPRNRAKALELWHRAGELGNVGAYLSIGNAYMVGRGVEVDLKKAKYYYGLAAMGGGAIARNNLGATEANAGNIGRALKHFIIAVKDGRTESLENIKMLYLDGQATKDDYGKALRSYQAYLDEIRSDQRDKAAAFKDGYKYY